MKTKNRTRGFTLIELMITLAIVSILAAVALPSYQSSVNKTQRADAKIKLSETAQIMERCYTEFNAYNNVSCPNIADSTTFTSFTSDEGYYTISGAIAADTFTLTATPVSGGAQAGDAKCTTFVLAHTGAKTATGSDSSNCW